MFSLFLGINSFKIMFCLYTNFCPQTNYQTVKGLLYSRVKLGKNISVTWIVEVLTNEEMLIGKLSIALSLKR